MFIFEEAALLNSVILCVSFASISGGLKCIQVQSPQKPSKELRCYSWTSNILLPFSDDVVEL